MGALGAVVRDTLDRDKLTFADWSGPPGEAPGWLWPEGKESCHPPWHPVWLWNSSHRIGYPRLKYSKNCSNGRQSLVATIRKELPECARMCADDVELPILHQDAFAAHFEDEEYIFLGMGIKYAGLGGNEVRLIGKNRRRLGQEEKQSSE